MTTLLLVSFLIGLVVVWVKSVLWAIRADRAERDRDELEALKRFHKTIDRDLTKLLRRGA